MRKATVVFEGKDYVIQEMRHRLNKKWRKKLEGHVEEVAAAIGQGTELEVSELNSIAQLIRSVGGFVLQSVDLMGELLVEYCPTLSDAVENGYDSEIADAFVEVLKLAYPFSSMINTLRRIGSQLPQTPQSSVFRMRALGSTSGSG